MGKFQATIKYLAVIVALFASNYSLPTHGRHIKPFKTSVNNVPTPPSEQKGESHVMPNYDVASFEDSGATSINAFQPTTPGNSPGVGHRYDNSMKSTVVVHSPDHVEISVTEGSKNAFKPTDPGHSPGVGHAYQNKIGHLY